MLVLKLSGIIFILIFSFFLKIKWGTKVIDIIELMSLKKHNNNIISK